MIKNIYIPIISTLLFVLVVLVVFLILLTFFVLTLKFSVLPKTLKSIIGVFYDIFFIIE